MNEQREAHPLDGLRREYPDYDITEQYHATNSGPGWTVYLAVRDGICVAAYSIPSLRGFLADAEAGRAKSKPPLRVIREP